MALAGSRNALYGVDTLRPGHPAILVEGIVDALAVCQVAGDLVARDFGVPSALWTRQLRQLVQGEREKIL